MMTLYCMCVCFYPEWWLFLWPKMYSSIQGLPRTNRDFIQSMMEWICFMISIFLLIYYSTLYSHSNSDHRDLQQNLDIFIIETFIHRRPFAWSIMSCFLSTSNDSFDLLGSHENLTISSPSFKSCSMNLPSNHIR